MSRALARRGFVPVHDRGRVLVDAAVLIADGGRVLSDLAMLRDQAQLFGSVASGPTVSPPTSSAAVGMMVALVDPQAYQVSFGLSVLGLDPPDILEANIHVGQVIGLKAPEMGKGAANIRECQEVDNANAGDARQSLDCGGSGRITACITCD